MDYKKSFSDMIDQFLLLTDQNKMTWSITTYEKKMDAIFVGENDVSYIISYEWEFSPSGWKIDTPSQGHHPVHLELNVQELKIYI